MGRGRRTAATCWLLVALAAVPAGVGGQSVEGTVRHGDTGEPLSGVLVSVLSTEGVRVRSVLTSASGGFALEIPAGRYRLRAARIGLRTETTEAFEVSGQEVRRERIEMTDRAVEIAGILVDSRVSSCRLDPQGATRIQRWWSEVSTALDVSDALQQEDLGPLLVERFERELDRSADDVIASNRSVQVSTSTRPFASIPVDRLAADGFVVGAVGGSRTFFAPDAEVLLSSTFLSQHCFSLADHGGREDQVGLRFEPVEGREVTDISGTFWVDTVTAELRDLDFSYTNLEGPPSGEAGGRVVFEYLPSGAWIVSDWYIRMPKLGARSGSSRLRTVGYLDVGGVVIPLSPPEPGGSPGGIRGVVVDSLRGGGLADAVVTILGTSRRASTGPDGSFRFLEVPEGMHYLSFTHAELARWGLDPGFVRVEVRGGSTADAELAVPSFEQTALALCLGAGVDAETVVVGRVVGPAREVYAGRGVRLDIGARARGGESEDPELELRTDEHGRFVACSVPGGEQVTVSVDLGRRWSEVADVLARDGELTYREVRINP